MEVKIQAEPCSPSEEKPKEYGKYDKWEIESAVRTLEEAEEIKMDAEKMKYVKMCMKKKNAASIKAMKSVESIADLRKLAAGEPDEEMDYES